jgi:hypothetical protein
LGCDGAASAACMTGATETTGEILDALWQAIPSCCGGSQDDCRCEFCEGAPPSAFVVAPVAPATSRGKSFCGDVVWTRAAVGAMGATCEVAAPVLREGATYRGLDEPLPRVGKLIAV